MCGGAIISDFIAPARSRRVTAGFLWPDSHGKKKMKKESRRVPVVAIDDADFRDFDDDSDGYGEHDLASPGQQLVDLKPFSVAANPPHFPHFAVTLAGGNAEIEVLHGANFKKWKDDLMYALGLHNMDLALHEDRPAEPIEGSTSGSKEYLAKWERSNRMCLLAMRRSISEHLMSGLAETTTAKELLVALGNRYLISDMAESAVLMKKLTSMSYDGVGGVRDHILQMVHLQTKLKAIDIFLPDKFIIVHALNSLPATFSQIKSIFISHDPKWSIEDLISKCVAEEDKIRREKNEGALVVIKSDTYTPKGKNGAKRSTSGPSKNAKGFKRHGKDQHKESPKTSKKLKVRCYFCHLRGHLKKDCFKYKAFLQQEKKEGVPEAKAAK